MGITLVVVGCAVLLLLPRLSTDYLTGIGLTLTMWIALTQSWCAFSSLTGYVSLGHSAFYGLGAYLVVATWQLIPLPAAIVLAGAAGVVFALLIGSPVLRVRGPYFVILTFGISELVKHIVIAYETASGTASRILFGAPDLNVIYYAMLALAALSVAVMFTLSRSRLGHALRSVRENEEAAETVGIPVAKVKLLAFMISAAVPAMVGGVMAMRSTYFEASQVFDPMISVTIIAMALIGGGDNARGPLLGVVTLTLLSELLWSHAPQIYMIILGVILVVFVLVLPDGLQGWISARRGRLKKVESCA